jgi:hypothetical protein
MAGESRRKTVPLPPPLLTAENQERLRDAALLSPSIFGRLAAVSELRHRDTGRYYHPLAAEFGAAQVDEALRRLHGEVFRSWLGLRLQQQERDLSIWLAWLDRKGQESAARLRGIARRLDDLLPAQHFEADRRLFFDDFRLLFNLMEQSDPFALSPPETAGPAPSRLRRLVDKVVGRNPTKEQRG